MVVIVSNGKQYSDHQLYFVEAPSIEAVEAVMNLPSPDDQDWYPNTDACVLGTAESLNWTELPRERRYSTMTLEAFTEEAKSYL